MLARARLLATLSRAPAAHLERQRARLHQQLREIRAGSRRRARLRAARDRSAARWCSSARPRRSLLDCRERRPRELAQLALALAGHDPQRTLERGYVLAQSRRRRAARHRRAARARPASCGCASPTALAWTAERSCEVDSSELEPRRRPEPASGQPQTYEAAAARVEEIIRRLDSGEASLDETLALVSEGKTLIELCASQLAAVGDALEELRLDELVGRLEREAGA